MENLELLQLASTTFAERLDAVGADQWDLPTPCEGWTVRDLVHHVVGGNAMVVVLADGGSADDGLAVLSDTELGGDVATQFADSAASQAAAFAGEGALERIFHHPAGDMPGEVVLGFRIGDLTIHAWDLARATGGDDALPDELVEAVHATLLPMAPMLGSIGMFGEGPSEDASAEAPLQDQMLDLAGRRP